MYAPSYRTVKVPVLGAWPAVTRVTQYWVATAGQALPAAHTPVPLGMYCEPDMVPEPCGGGNDG